MFDTFVEVVNGQMCPMLTNRRLRSSLSRNYAAIGNNDVLSVKMEGHCAVFPINGCLTWENDSAKRIERYEYGNRCQLLDTMQLCRVNTSEILKYSSWETSLVRDHSTFSFPDRLLIRGNDVCKSLSHTRQIMHFSIFALCILFLRITVEYTCILSSYALTIINFIANQLVE